MTTKVTVDAHAGWPVEVSQIQTDGNGNASSEPIVSVVMPNTTVDFYIHSHMEIKLRELKN